MLNQTLPAAPADCASDVWIVDVVRTPLDSPGGALHEVQPSALLAGLAGKLCRSPHETGEGAALDILIVGAAARGSVAAEVPSLALSRAGFPAKVAVSSLEGGDEAGLEAIRLAVAQLRAGDAGIAMAGAIHVPSRSREQRRANPDALGALAAQAVSPRVAADAAVALQGIVSAEVGDFVERARQAGAPQTTAGIVPVLDLNGLTIAATDATDEPDTPQVPQRNAVEALQAHQVLARSVYPQLGEIPHMHTAATDAPAREGAVLCLLVRADAAGRLGWRPRARVAACAAAGHRSLQAGEALNTALSRALYAAQWSLESVDHVVICSRFAGVQMAAARALRLGAAQIDVSPAAWWHANAGAVSPVLALNRLVEALKASGGRRGALVAYGDGGCVVVVLVERGNDD